MKYTVLFATSDGGWLLMWAIPFATEKAIRNQGHRVVETWGHRPSMATVLVAARGIR